MSRTKPVDVGLGAEQPEPVADAAVSLDAALAAGAAAPEPPDDTAPPEPPPAVEPEKKPRSRRRPVDAPADDDARAAGLPGAHDAPLVDDGTPAAADALELAKGVFVGVGISGIQTADDHWTVDEATGRITGHAK